MGVHFYSMCSCHLKKVNKEVGSPRNEENKKNSDEINEVLEDEDKHNQSSNSKSEELKDICGKKGRLWTHSQNQLENTAISWSQKQKTNIQSVSSN